MGDEGWAGRQITCPSCQTAFTVPAFAGAVRAIPAIRVAPAPAAVSDLPPVIPVARPGAAPATIYGAQQPPFSTLGLISFILSLLGALCIPAVVCGHIALHQARKRPGTRGRGFAIAGLAIGYVSILLFLGLVVLFVIGRSTLKEQIEAAQRAQSSFPTVASAPTGPRPPMMGGQRPGTAPPAIAQRPRVTPVDTDPATAVIPESKLTGTLYGQTFTPNKVVLQGGTMLHIQAGVGFLPESEIIVFLFPRPGESIAGKSFLVPEAGNSMNPHVHFRTNRGAETKSDAITGDYAMRLEFGARSGRRLPGKLYLELPDTYQTKIAGTFDAVVE